LWTAGWKNIAEVFLLMTKNLVVAISEEGTWQAGNVVTQSICLPLKDRNIYRFSGRNKGDF